MMRTGVHYLSMGAAGFLLVIMGIGVLKYLLFALLFALSAGKLSFWLFPNLTEDVGFIESFMPVYDYTYTGNQFKVLRNLKDLIHICQETKAQGRGMTLNMNYVGSNYPYFISYRGLC